MKQRVLTALALAPVVLAACVVRTPFPLFIICLLIATLGFWELRQMLGQPKALPVLTLFGIAVPFFGTEIQANRDATQIILYAFVFWIVGIAFVLGAVRRKTTTTAGLDLAGLWISMPLTCLLMLHKLMPAHPMWLTDKCFILLILIPLWGGDIVALLIGSRFGKHLLAPKISPKKSWEGAIANFLTCVLLSATVMPVIGEPKRLWLGISCGAVIGVVGQLGDLFESWIKRNLGTKDSGTILPGHGGVLDRIDSLLFVAPVLSLVLVIYWGLAIKFH